MNPLTARIRSLLAVATALLCSAAAHSQQINPIDPAFTISPALSAVPEKIAVDSLDRVIAVGDFVVMINGHTQRGVARFLSDGSLDTGFDCGSGFDSGVTVTGLRVQSDNKVVVLGTFTSFNGKPAAGWLRLTTTGAIDTAFVPAVVSPGLTALDSRGRFCVVDAGSIVRLTANGANDSTFQPHAVDGTVLALAADSDDKPIFVFEQHVSAPLGIKNYITSDASATVSRLSETGAVEYSRELWGETDMLDYLNKVSEAQVVPLANGAYYLSYFIWHSSLGSQVGEYQPIRKFNRDGSADGTFSTNLHGRIVRLSASGAMYVLDSFIAPPTVALPSHFNEPIRLLADGSEDITFNSEGTSLAPVDYNHETSLKDAAVTSTGALLISFAGSVPTDGDQTRTLVARYRYADYTPFGPSFAGAIPTAAYAVTGEPFTITLTANGTDPLTYEWLRNGIAVATGNTLTLADPQNSDAGTYTLKVSSPYGSVTSSPIEIHVQPQNPVVVTQPSSIALGEGSVGTLSAIVTGASPLSFQWFKDGQAIIGATTPTLTLIGARSVEGDYVMVAGNAKGTATTLAAHVSFVTTHVVNISTRSWVGAGDSVQIAGFVIKGTAPKTVLIRAAGPALIPLHVSRTLPDPRLELHDALKGNIVIGTNDDWSSDSATAAEIEKAAARTGAFGWTRGSKDAAILKTLAPGIYTAIVADAGGNSGAAMIEVYDADEAPTGSLLVNISTRAQARTGDDIMIAGFVINGSEKRTVLIRGAGPALGQLNVGGTLGDPTLELHDASHANAVIATNDDWSSEPAAAAKITDAVAKTGAFAWTLGSTDAALLLDLNPGIYTVVLSGKGSTSGNALIEVYDVP